MSGAKISEDAIRSWCLDYMRRVIADPAVPVGPDVTFPRIGLDSATSAYFVVELEEWLGIELDPEIVIAHPTIAELAHHLAGLLPGGDA